MKIILFKENPLRFCICLAEEDLLTCMSSNSYSTRLVSGQQRRSCYVKEDSNSLPDHLNISGTETINSRSLIDYKN
jgi:hypothetical protein